MRVLMRFVSRALLVLAFLIGLTLVTLQAAGMTRISWGSSLPATCLDGNIFVKTGGSAGLKFCQSSAWTDVGGGGGGGGGWTLLDSQSASSSSSLDFVTGLDSTYGAYVFVLHHVRPATNGASLYARVSTDGGSTWLTSNYATSFHYSGSGGGHGATGAGATTFWYVADLLSNSSNYGASGEFWLDAPSGSPYKLARSSVVNPVSTGDGAMYLLTNGYQQATATAVDGFQLFMSTGDIASGEVELFGVEH